jgi:hypothetical protein
MQNNLSVVGVPFPKGLMSTARNPLTMAPTYGREITNMLVQTDGAGFKRNGVVPVTPALPNGESIVGLFVYAGVAPQLIAVGSNGTIYGWSGTDWQTQYTGLNPLGTPRAVTFAGKLVLCNGFNNLIMYNGTAWEEVATLVVDQGTPLTWLAANRFSITSDATLYPTGSRVRAKVAGAYVEANVSSATTSGNVVTVTLDSAVLGTVAANLTEVAFTVKPPKVAYLAVAHDRLWGFGKGVLSPTMSGDVDRLRVYYTYGVNDPTAWPDTETGSIPSINLADKAGVADELLAMAVKDDMTVFMGRNHMQLWVGHNPVYTASSQGDFMWSKTIPLGIIHGSAVLSLPNDLLFVTRTGVRTLSRTIQTEQLDVADVGGELDPTIATAMQQLLPQQYRKVMGLQEPVQGWFGLCMGSQTLVWQVGTFGRGWVIFTGAFADVEAACTAPNGTVYLAKAGRVFVYDATCYDDAGEPITTRWWTPWLHPNGVKRWAHKYAEVLMARGSAMAVTLRRYTDDDDGNPAVFAMSTPEVPNYWNEAFWDEATWDSGNNGLKTSRDHAVLQSISLCVETVTTTGPFCVFGLKLYGVKEK